LSAKNVIYTALASKQAATLRSYRRVPLSTGGSSVAQLVTFIVPVRHPENATDWSALRGRLAETVASIAAQSDPDWRAVVVANYGADLPALPKGFSVEWVEFPPNASYDIRHFDLAVARDSVRLDKGRRVLAGMLAAGGSDYFMVVDDDDFISSQLVRYVKAHKGDNGWKISKGWLWSEGGRLVAKKNNFSDFCGTSLIIKADLYQLPNGDDPQSTEYIKTMLGSHVRIAGIFADQGNPLAPLPFRGAVYRIGHLGAHSASRSMLKHSIFNPQMLRRPLALLRNVLGFRSITRAMRAEFSLPMSGKRLGH
jgi:hypothetical protein